MATPNGCTVISNRHVPSRNHTLTNVDDTQAGRNRYVTIRNDTVASQNDIVTNGDDTVAGQNECTIIDNRQVCSRNHMVSANNETQAHGRGLPMSRNDTIPVKDDTVPV